MNAFLPVIRWPLCPCKSSLEQLENVVIGDLPGAPLEYVSPNQGTKLEEEGSEGLVADPTSCSFSSSSASSPSQMRFVSLTSLLSPYGKVAQVLVGRLVFV